VGLGGRSPAVEADRVAAPAFPGPAASTVTSRASLDSSSLRLP
jgi:hypothetical protein